MFIINGYLCFRNIMVLTHQFRQEGPVIEPMKGCNQIIAVSQFRHNVRLVFFKLGTGKVHFIFLKILKLFIVKYIAE